MSLTGRLFFCGREDAPLAGYLRTRLGCLGDLLACAGAQRLQLFQRKVVSHEACRAIRESEIGAARVAAAKGADSIIQLELLRAASGS